jgi:hypothetical protein
VNGPAILSGPKAASIWSKALGKEIRYAGDNLDLFEEQMRKHAPSWAAFGKSTASDPNNVPNCRPGHWHQLHEARLGSIPWKSP